MEISEGKGREQRIESLCKNEKKLPNLVKEIDTQVQRVQRVPNKVNPKTPTPSHILIKTPKAKDKERILKQQEKSS